MYKLCATQRSFAIKLLSPFPTSLDVLQRYQLADAALSEALKLISDNRDLFSTRQRNTLLDTQGSLSKQHQELVSRSWFSLGSDKSTQHLENSQKLLTQVKEAIDTAMRNNARSGCVLSTSTNKSIETAEASTCQSSEDLQFVKGGVGATTAPRNPQDASTGISCSEIPPPYTSDSADAIYTPLGKQCRWFSSCRCILKVNQWRRRPNRCHPAKQVRPHQENPVCGFFDFRSTFAHLFC
ncbi:hypothetical protein PAXRUDRAFT_158982 [Paxillus rubicundulus Ve08.2h10]|uniref:Uncharacterized protein n=1 Tax=Paxillus rubicundulus Ve08.2h10 TaxID=930991 RepID=A0A0D0DGC8_9AGAM|nr:hypothetical protein PAXRUDRAFT_158982 [Paxillus rubicundulus Ve08.2h10]